MQRPVYRQGRTQMVSVNIQICVKRLDLFKKRDKETREVRIVIEV